MKVFLLISLVLFPSLCLTAVIQAVAVSNEDRNDEAVNLENSQDTVKLTKTEEDEISEIQKKVLFLQESVAEITRSFSTLELVAKNPSMMAKIHIPDTLETVHGQGGPEKKRLRRQVGASSTLPTSLPSSENQQTNCNRNQLGPYSWPMFSGQCFLCPAGVPGPRGPPGPQGIAGRDGRDGRDSQISPQAQETPTPPSNLTNTGGSRGDGIVRPVINTTSSLPGVIYIRWGHNECPEGAQLIYSGIIGGAHYTHTGSGANHLCMPHEPIYDEVETSLHAERALLYSSEYETNVAPERLRSVHDQTPTCAVCRAPSGRTTQLMIPARNVCPSEEWRLEYAGYLMAAKYTYKRSEFVCVDRAVVPESGTRGNQDGALLFMTEARCLAGGGLECGPYVDGYELTCAVCTI